MARTTQMVPCRKKEIFFFSDEPSQSVYLVKKGQIKLFRTTADGREIILDILGPGEIFGELALAGETSRSHSAEALEDGLVCILPRKIFEGLARRHPEFAFRIIKLIGLRFRALESRVEDLAFQNVHDRLLFTLGNLAKKHGIPGRRNLGGGGGPVERAQVERAGGDVLSGYSPDEAGSDYSPIIGKKKRCAF